jgi:hypothetical protein
MTGLVKTLGGKEHFFVEFLIFFKSGELFAFYQANLSHLDRFELGA